MIATFGLANLATPLYARLLPRAGGAKKLGSAAGATASISKGVTTTVKLRSDRRAVLVTFSNLTIATSVTYALTYTAKGLPQGAQGSVTQGGLESVTRELLLGTCSGGTCRYDSGVSDAKLTITTKLKSGKKVVKTYRIKV